MIRHLDDLLAGLTLLSKYGVGEVRADHDIIWAGPDDLDKADYQPDIADNLEKFNWEFDEDVPAWSYRL